MIINIAYVVRCVKAPPLLDMMRVTGPTQWKVERHKKLAPREWSSDVRAFEDPEQASTEYKRTTIGPYYLWCATGLVHPGFVTPDGGLASRAFYAKRFATLDDAVGKILSVGFEIDRDMFEETRSIYRSSLKKR